MGSGIPPSQHHVLVVTDIGATKSMASISTIHEPDYLSKL